MGHAVPAPSKPHRCLEELTRGSVKIHELSVADAIASVLDAELPLALDTPEIVFARIGVLE